ncbi:PspC domain-containing protein [Mycetocola reblochoni]|uniref:Phage shock protein C, PspC n=2 Tax=Mycetocola reblochoni TaxID=331618 RepID=A0A1R4IU81_9MICO|nr:PspC domain-containing protein [Mycetocola reblochoni]RLP71031.1 PspC domain-containing protein [Mycetocola reblochoni]SJN23431.1 phage shock protein C, PspC [Mycetocola reblochoni REB411]
MANSFFDTLRRSPIRRGPERVVGGICGGIANRFDWNPWVVRLLTLVAFLLPVIGVGLYIVLWLFLPRWDGSIIVERLLSRGRNG